MHNDHQNDDGFDDGFAEDMTAMAATTEQIFSHLQHRPDPEQIRAWLDSKGWIIPDPQ